MLNARRRNEKEDWRIFSPERPPLLRNYNILVAQTHSFALKAQDFTSVWKNQREMGIIAGAQRAIRGLVWQMKVKSSCKTFPLKCYTSKQHTSQGVNTVRWHTERSERRPELAILTVMGHLRCSCRRDGVLTCTKPSLRPSRALIDLLDMASP